MHLTPGPRARLLANRARELLQSEHGASVLDARRLVRSAGAVQRVVGNLGLGRLMTPPEDRSL